MQIQAIQRIEGITISGGEPLQQIAPLTELLRFLRHSTRLSSIVFTGFEVEEINQMPGHEALFSLVDVVVAGRYKMEKRLAAGLRGSSNKQLLFLSNRYSAADFENLPEAEVIIGPDGEITLSGIDPVI